jgi:hypothetical protein
MYKPKMLFIGVDPEYTRRSDVLIQTSLRRPYIKVVFSLEDLSKQIKNFLV